MKKLFLVLIVVLSVFVIGCSDDGKGKNTVIPEEIVIVPPAPITTVAYVITGTVEDQKAFIAYTNEFGDTKIIWICTLPKTISYTVGTEYYLPSIEVNNLTFNSSLNVQILLNDVEDMVGSCGGSGCQVYLEETE